VRPGVLITLLALLSGGGVALSGCTAGSSAKPAGPACAADRVPAVSPSGQPVAWGVPRSVPTTTGQVSAAVTGVHDPVALPPASSLVSKGCRWIGVDLWLTAGPDPANADLSHTASVVSADGAAYRPSPLGPTGRNGIGNLDLVGGDNRRGTLIFEVPATARIRYLAIGPSLRVDLAGPAPTGGPGAPDVSAGPAPTGGPGAPDVSAGTPAPLPPYAPGNWPGPGTPQTVDRLSGEKIEITPLRVHEDAPPDRTLRDGYRLYAVQLRMRVTGSQPWPLNPDHLATIVDDTGAQWLTAFATSTETPGFDPLQDQPGAEQTAWVAFEIPRTARPVALMLSSYPGRIWPWRL
jgi:hypothetical protein